MITIEGINSCEDVIKQIRDELKFYEYVSYYHFKTIKHKYINKI